MVLKAPFPILPSSTVLLSLSPMVEVLGQRSWAFPLLNSSLIYRKTCATIRPDMGRLIMPMYGQQQPGGHTVHTANKG